ncbi:hypothetical protein NADFUDRAFT_53295 [Nadsonia fulvescens var. elongata DSM 6958]|uniref:Ribosome biogenesis protein SLX9 n=1 Tax=Nadsonia fulvescens var. elongata DSM 6958 TaxID=857566 RepID=A0A1E3PEK6_9ASCO|nr:hypothetical protein NADFUDRAFT_53295 [Nadsonia fulvescens var. elongata DSM 6958]
MAASKKRTTLRTRSAPSAASGVAAAAASGLDIGSTIDSEVPYLHQLNHTTKKEKRETKHQGLLSKLNSGKLGTGATGGSISKSSLRRHKRKQSEKLGVNLNDLLEADENLNSLLATGSTATDKSSDIADTINKFVSDTKKNVPNPKKNLRANEIIVKSEISRFNNVLKQDEFKKSPFATLKDFIKGNLEKKEEFTALEGKKLQHNQNDMQIE